MEPHHLLGLQPKLDYDRGRSLWQNLRNLFNRKSSELVDLEALATCIHVRSRYDQGYQAIPVRQIAGSVGRHTDFDGDFVPRFRVGRERCESIARLYQAGKTLPPIEVYQIGALYFVIDGNHRVAVHRARRVEFIDAHVIQFQTDIDIRTTTEARAIYRKN
jgi:hypothetical protein